MTAYQLSHPQPANRDAITAAYRKPEPQAIADLLASHHISRQTRDNAQQLAAQLVSKVRAQRKSASGVDALMQEFSLSSEEGLALMCLAEALLRIPDTATRNALIKDKLSRGDWKSHLHQSPSLFVNAAAWGLMLTGKLTAKTNDNSLTAALTRALGKGGEPLIRGGMNYAMRLLGKQFVTGQTIEEALANGKPRQEKGYLYSFDMLGEAAITADDATRYYNDYQHAIHAIGKHNPQAHNPRDVNGISVKLSALFPRYSRAQHSRVLAELLPRLRELCRLAKHYQIGINIDAEEADRLELSLDLITALIQDPELQGFSGLGVVVQAYQKRCPYVIDYLIDIARAQQQTLMVRLVKGAYWDSEIKWTQLGGYSDYPVYTQKLHTDLSYLVCAEKLLNAQDVIFPQFATHNAHTLAMIYHMAGDKAYEFQCLHGMGETLYDEVVGAENLQRRCRIYAPVGTHETLLAYLVRRLLENGANSSFVNQIVNEAISIDSLIADPITAAEHTQGAPHPLIPLPKALYGTRENANGVDLSDEHQLATLEDALNQAAKGAYIAQSSSTATTQHQSLQTVHNPADKTQLVGYFSPLAVESVTAVITAAEQGFAAWRDTPAAQRAACIRRFAALLESEKATLFHLAITEAGKTLENAVGEVREAIDFCHYYAEECEKLAPEGRGVMAVISPWNFPLAIFVGQTIAALAAGNSVVTKPAEQTPLIAHLAVKLMHRAGIPETSLQLVLGAGEIGAALVADKRIAGVLFTGSTQVAQGIAQVLAKREDLPVLIAETGGLNAMIVDSSALPEQVVTDVVRSAFDSAGQRCSALRILCVQEEIADSVITMLKGAMQELCLGNPMALAVDIGAVIDAEAQAKLNAHIEQMRAVARSVYQLPLPEACADGWFVAPTLVELTDLSALSSEQFGPILHVVRFERAALDALIAEINAKGYALTHGVHSRIDETVATVRTQVAAGNVYVNRNVIGAVVGVQPFGGFALSGTGPKAGGAFYLQRLSTAKRWQLPELSVPACCDEERLERAVTALRLAFPKLDWTAAAAQARSQVLQGAGLVLRGATGEENSLHYAAPKAVALWGGSVETAGAALLALAANGVQAVIAPDSPLAVLSDADYLRVDSALGSVAGSVGSTGSTGSAGSANAKLSTEIIVLLDKISAADKTTLLNRTDKTTPILRFIDAENGIDTAQICHEISTSENTSAAGGNASLMAVV